MNLRKLFQDVKPHLLALLAFLLLGFAYYAKTFKGYTHKEDDVTQGLLKGTELVKYTDRNGDVPGWTNSIFSGMPSTMIKGKAYVTNYLSQLNYLSPINSTEYPFKILILSFIGFYILMNAFKVKPLFGAMAAIAYGFATYSISSVEAAHYTKVLAMALIPAVLASMHWLFNGRYLLGSISLAFNFGLQIYYFHYQITYYTVICMLVMGIYYLVELIRNNKYKQLLIAVSLSLIASFAAVFSNIGKIQSTANFAKSTMRGGNDMAKSDASYNQKETGKNGLKRDYAFDWSYGKAETFTLLIPNFYGGSSSEKLSKSSKFYEVTQNEEYLDQGLPLYHGELGFTSGPIYVGAVIVFLFVIGIFIVRDSIKWPILVLTIISFILGWGKHFSLINDFLFDYLPYYNKFRTPMMAFSIAQVSMPLLGFLGLKQVYETWTEEKKSKQNAKPAEVKQNDQQDSSWLLKNIKYAYYAVGGFCLLMALAGPSFMDMGGVVDEQLKEGGNGNLISVLKEDRASLLQKDAFRSFAFISLTFALLWSVFKRKLKKQIAMALIGAFAVIDLIGVDLRYLSWDDFIHEKGSLTNIEKDRADELILADKDLHYRVFDLTGDPFNNNEGAAFHKMIGGYDPAKLSRYQDLIAEILSKREYSEKGLDVLNCKYIIGNDSGKRGVIPRTTMNGNAWFVRDLLPATNASKEMSLFKTSDHRYSATFDQSFSSNKGLMRKTYILDSLTRAELITYHPDTMNYKLSNANDGFLVLSEIWYENWKAEIDGEPVPVHKVNYTLRGISVPAGEHSIKFYFDKGSNRTNRIEQIVSSLILAGMLLLILVWIRTYFSEKA